MSDRNIVKGCVVMMSAKSGLTGYGNPQCVSDICEPLGTVSLYGHNQHYKTRDVAKVLEWPASREIERLQGEVERYKGVINELCRLKEIKDKFGKNSDYLREKAEAWSAAFELSDIYDGMYDTGEQLQEVDH